MQESGTMNDSWTRGPSERSKSRASKEGGRGQGTVVSSEFGPSIDDHAELPNKSF